MTSPWRLLQLIAPDPEEVRLLRGHKLSVTCLVITPDEKYIFSASKDCSIIKCESDRSTVLCFNVSSSEWVLYVIFRGGGEWKEGAQDCRRTEGNRGASRGTHRSCPVYGHIIWWEIPGERRCASVVLLGLFISFILIHFFLTQCVLQIIWALELHWLYFCFHALMFSSTR